MSFSKKICRLSYRIRFRLGWVCSADKVINQKLRSAKIMRGKQFSIRSGVRESDLILAQIWTIYKVVPVTENKIGKHKQRPICYEVVRQQMLVFTWGTRACVRRCPGVSSCWRPRCDWCRRWLALALWNSTKLSGVQTSTSLPRNPLVQAPRLPCIPVSIHMSHYADTAFFFNSVKIYPWLEKEKRLWSLTSCMCSAMRHPLTFLSLEMKRKVLVLEGHLVSTCWKPRSLSTTSLISSTWRNRQKTSKI